MNQHRETRQLFLIRLSFVAIWFITSTTCWGSATVSLKVVARNGVPVAPTNAISITQNDTITAEVYFSGWATPPFDSPTNTGLVQTYQATLMGAAGATSNGSDGSNNAELVLPVGWDAPIVMDSCPCGFGLFPICTPNYGCVGPSHLPANMASINASRSDWIFLGFDTIRAVDLSSLNIRWGGAINGPDGQSSSRCQGGGNAGFTCVTNVDCPGGTCNANFLSYGGTLNLKAGAQACGTYTFTFANDVLKTFICNPEAIPICVLPAIEGLTVTVTGANCPCASDTFLADPTGIAKARFLSFSTAMLNCPGALRVHLLSLHHVNPPYTGGASVPFTSFEGQVRWVGPPVQYVESTSNAIPFYSSSLQCDPHYQDWSAVGLLHVTGSAIVPSSIYEVENVAVSCMGNEATCAAVSAPLSISTTRWGDVETPYNPPSATAQPDVGDISALVNKFRSAPGAPIKARALLAGDDAFGNITTLGIDLGFGHIAACVDAFRGAPYTYTIAACP